jgi:hypothetical protein
VEALLEVELEERERNNIARRMLSTCTESNPRRKVLG